MKMRSVFYTICLLLCAWATPRLQSKTQGLTLLKKDKAGHGILCTKEGKLLLMVSGTPEEMGTAHGNLLKTKVNRLVERVVYLVGSADTAYTGEWFFDKMRAIEKRTSPFIPKRFFRECDAMSKAAGLSKRDGRYANLFPERFHCSGVALRGEATKGGEILHARVLDYMRDIGLQRDAVVVLFIPNGKNAWMSQGYAGLIGTVTAMNIKGLAIGEMGGRGEGSWDGTPMTFLLRDVMERAGTVKEAVKIIEKAKRTCEYYYVLSDKSGDIIALHCTPEKVEKLFPGVDHPLLPPVPKDTVFVSGTDRAKVLAKRINKWYGKIDAKRLMEIIKRPVAMRSNLHDAIFLPRRLEMWCADAGKRTLACNEKYVLFRMKELMAFFKKKMGQ